VGTKYPGIAERHFAARGVQTEMVKLHGNVELAPLIGLADCVVDVTATGRTLRQNNLRIIEEISASTARFVANPVSVRIDSERIMGLARRLAEVASGRGGEGGQGR
jgi:ATP phosphoribosyltransferase